MKKLYTLLAACIMTAAVSAQTTTVTTKQLVVSQTNGETSTYDVSDLERATFERTESEPSYRYMMLRRKRSADVRIYMEDVTNITYKEETSEIELPKESPKVGDYYYSDGTWSDGGLVSIGEDGTNPVWAEEKPAPIEGKEVIGIVAMTNPDRIAERDKADGFTHGYVIATKFVHDPNNIDPRDHNNVFTTTKFTWDDEFEANIAVKNLSSSAYQDLDGRDHCNNVIAEYGDKLMSQCPAVYYTNIKSHPATSSEWFVPSVGQLWDIVANLSGHEAATAMKEWRTQDLNIWWGYCTSTINEDPMEIFNSTLEKVADIDKEPLVREDYDEIISNPKYNPDNNDSKAGCPIWTSTRNSTDSMNNITVGTKKKSGKADIAVDVSWYNGDAYLRPILAF